MQKGFGPPSIFLLSQPKFVPLHGTPLRLVQSLLDFFFFEVD